MAKKKATKRTPKAATSASKPDTPPKKTPRKRVKKAPFVKEKEKSIAQLRYEAESRGETLNRAYIRKPRPDLKGTNTVSAARATTEGETVSKAANQRTKWQTRVLKAVAAGRTSPNDKEERKSKRKDRQAEAAAKPKSATSKAPKSTKPGSGEKTSGRSKKTSVKQAKMNARKNDGKGVQKRTSASKRSRK